MTWKGRVVYDRPKNRFKKRDLSRIAFAFRWDKTPYEFGKFFLEVLEDLMIRMEYRQLEEANFWQPFMEKTVAVGIFWPKAPIEDVVVKLFAGLPGSLAGAKEIDVGDETYIIDKRKRQKGGL